MHPGATLAVLTLVELYILTTGVLLWARRAARADQRQTSPSPVAEHRWPTTDTVTGGSAPIGGALGFCLAAIVLVITLVAL